MHRDASKKRLAREAEIWRFDVIKEIAAHRRILGKGHPLRPDSRIRIICLSYYMLSENEKTDLINALRRWAATVPDRPTLGFLGSDFLTPKQIVDAAIREDDNGKTILEILEHGVRREGLEAVTERLSRSYGSTGSESLPSLTR